MSHWMQWVWLFGAVYFLVAQVVGMSPLGDGWGLSKVMDRLLGYHPLLSIALGAFWVWMPTHFLLGRTSTAFGGVYEVGSWVLGGALGLLAWRTRQERDES